MKRRNRIPPTIKTTFAVFEDAILLLKVPKIRLFYTDSLYDESSKKFCVTGGCGVSPAVSKEC
jgi:hypothetical protein